MTAPTDFVPFSRRYGIHDHQLGASVTASRHGKVIHHGAIGEQCEADTSPLRCACPGARFRRCCQRATAEDRLCDACRDWCWATDGVNPSVRIIDAFPASA